MTPIYNELVATLGNPLKAIIGKQTPAQQKRARKKAARRASQLLRDL